MTTILIIDDEPSIRSILRLGLKSRGFEVIEAGTGQVGIERVREHRPHLIILDLGLPDGSGSEILKQIRSWSKVPVIVLTVRDDEDSKVSLLESGADDYMTKPFSMPELLARITVALRHHPEDGAAAPIFESGNLRVDLVGHHVSVDGAEVHLTVTEFNLLKLLARQGGRVASQDMILKEIWGPHALENSHYLRIYISQLRKKLEANPAAPAHIVTEPGIGYRLI